MELIIVIALVALSAVALKLFSARRPRKTIGLQKRFELLGKMQGMTKDEIITEVGKPHDIYLPSGQGNSCSGMMMTFTSLSTVINRVFFRK